MSSEILTLNDLARRLRVPARWLREEADAGRLPCVRAGSQRLFDAETVERELLQRASGGVDATRPQREEGADASE